MLILCDSGDRRVNDFVIGTIWASKEAFINFEMEILELRIKEKYWGELKWSKTIGNEKTLNFYKKVIKLFLDSRVVNFSVVVVNKDKLKSCGQHMGKNFLSSIPNFIYVIVSRRASKYCERTVALNIIADKGELQTKVNTLKKILTVRIGNDPELKKIGVTLEHVTMCDSHICSSMQICDFLSGAITARTNKLIFPDNKKVLVQQIESKLEIDLSKPTPIYYKKFNIWHWTPSNMVTKHLTVN